MRDEIRLFKNNELAYKLMLLFVVCETIFSIMVLKKMVTDWQIGLFIIIVIFVSLISFLAAVKLRVYSITWGYISVIIGISQLTQLLFTKGMEGVMLLNILFVIGIVAAIAGGILTISEGKKRVAFIANNNING